MIEFGGRPADWIVRGGRPAEVLGDVTRRGSGGLPSAEDDNGFVVFEMMRAGRKSSFGNLFLFPWRYSETCEAFGGGLVPLHHQPSQRWAYRPGMYRLTMHKNLERQGSQRELDWRYTLHTMYRVIDEGEEAIAKFFEDDPLLTANRKARELLQSMLGPTQLVELELRDSFRVIGGASGFHYEIQLGNGFARVDPLTNEPIISYCLHPEDWMPDADVALSHKLNLECVDLEVETIEAANANPREPRRAAASKVKDFRYAADMERELIA